MPEHGHSGTLDRSGRRSNRHPTGPRFPAPSVLTLDGALRPFHLHPTPQTMSTDAPSHAAGGSPSEPQVPEPSHAEQARTLMARASEGTLGTLSTRLPGSPFVSLAPYAEDDEGGVLLLVSDLAVHTRNLKADPRASLLVREPDPGDRDALGLGRVTLVGAAEPVDAADARARYLERHPNARYWVDYPDFSFRRLVVEEAYFVGGFGVMGWVEGDAYRQARPDPLVDAAEGIVRHVNEDHSDALRLLARESGIDEVEEARMTRVDRLGFHLRVRTPKRVRGLRLPFPAESRTPEAVREAMVTMVKQARR